MKAFVVYSCYSESFEDPSIYFEVCGTKEKANEIFEGFTKNATNQVKDCFNDRFDEDCEIFEDKYCIDESSTTFVCREVDGDKCWEVYVIEQEVLT